MDQIDVVIRVRPMIKREIGSECIWTTDHNCIKCKDKAYNFDRVFGQSHYNIDIYNEIGKPLVKNVMQGINGTLFAYGQTASGKTHTIIGESTELGIVPLAIKDIFAHINESPSREFLLRASYMEIYNEEIKDLLANSGKETIRVRTSVTNETVIDNLSEHTITSYENVMELIESGIRNRKIGTTNLNERSSRSHCIFQLVIESRAISDDANGSELADDGAVIVSQLNLVDLAGSERSAQTGAQGIRFKESNYINTSLLTLGLVIRKLSENEKNTHIPYRDSKLTRILQHSLGGNSKTSIIVTVSPVVYEETTHTLQFAERAKNVKNKPIVNEVVDGDTMLRRQKREILDLKKKIAELESGPSFVQHTDMANKQRKMAELLKQIICAGPRKKEQSVALQRIHRRQTCCPSEFRMMEQKNFQMEDELLDDTTLNFEKLEYKFLQEEIELAKSSTTDTVSELKSSLVEKDEQIEELLKHVKELQSQVADIPTLKIAMESLSAENELLQASYEKNNEKYMALTRRADSEKEQYETKSSDKEECKHQLIKHVTSFQEQFNDADTQQVLTEVMEKVGYDFVPKDMLVQLNGDLGTLKDALQSLGDENQKLQNTVDKQAGDLTHLKSKEESTSNQLRILEKERDNKSKQVDQLLHESFTNDKDELKELLKSKDDALLEKEQYISNIQAKNEEKELELTEKDKEISDLRHKLEATPSSSNQCSDIGTLKDVIETLSEENQHFQDAFDKKTTENVSLLSQVTDLEKQVKLLQDKQDELMLDISKHVTVKENLLNELNENKNNFEAHMKELNSVQQNQEEKHSVVESFVTNLKEKLRCKDDVLSEKEQCILKLQETINEKEMEVMQKNNEMTQMRNEVTQSVRDATNQDSDVAALRDALQSQGDRNQHLQRTVDKQVEELALLRSEEESLNNQLKFLQNERDSKSNEVEQLLQESAQFIVAKENILGELTGVISNRDDLQKQLEERCARIDDLESTISQLKEQLESKENALLENAQNISNSKANDEQKDLEATEKDKEISDLKCELVTAQSMITESSDVAAHRDALQSQGDENQRLQKIVDKQIEELALLRNKEESLNNQLKFLQNERDSKSNEVEQLLQESAQFIVAKENILGELTGVISNRDDLQKQLEERCARIADLESTISQLKEQLKSKENALLENAQNISNSKANDEQKDLEATEKDKEISDLKCELVTAQSMITESSDVATLRDALQSLGEGNQHLQKTVDKQVEELALLRSKEESLNNQLETLQNERDNKSNEVEQLLQESAQFIVAKENILGELAGVISNRDDLQKQLEERCARIDDLVSTISQLKEQLESKENELLQKAENISNDEQSMITESSDTNIVKSQLESLENENSDLKSLIAVKTDECNQLCKQEELLSAKLEHLQRDNEGYIVTVDELQKKVSEFVIEKENIVIQIESLKNENRDLHTAIEQKTEECIQLEALQQTMIDAKDELQKKVSEFIIEKENVVIQIESLKNENRDLHTAIEQKTEECIQLEALQQTMIDTKDVDTMQKQVESLQSKIDELQMIIELKTEESISLSSQKDLINEELKNIQIEREGIIKRVEDLEEKVSLLDVGKVNLLNELETVKKDNDDMRSNVQEKVEECLRLSDLVEKSTFEMEHLQTEKDKYIRKVDELEENNSQLNLEKENITNEMNEVRTNSDTLEKEIGVLKVENEELSEKKHELESLLTDTNVLLSEKSEDLKKRESRIIELQNEKKENETKIEEKDDEIMQLSKQFMDFKSTIADKTEEITTLKSNIDLKRKDIKVYATTVSEQNSAMEKLQEKHIIYKEKIEKLTNDLKEVQKPCGNADVKDWNIKVTDLEKSNFQLTERHQKLQSEFKDLKQKEYELSCCKESLETSNKTLLSDIDKLKASLETEKDTSKNSLLLLKDRLKSKYEKVLDDQKKGHVRIEQGLETAYEKYKHYKQLYLDTNTECDKYRKMLEEVSAVAQQSKLKNKRPIPNSEIKSIPCESKSIKPTEESGPLSVSSGNANIEVGKKDSTKRKLEEIEDDNESSKKVYTEKASTSTSSSKLRSDKDDGCQQQ